MEVSGLGIMEEHEGEERGYEAEHQHFWTSNPTAKTSEPRFRRRVVEVQWFLPEPPPTVGPPPGT